MGVAEPGQFDEFEQRLRPVGKFTLLVPRGRQPEEMSPRPRTDESMAASENVLHYRHAGENPRRLEGADQAELRDPPRRQIVDALPVKIDISGIGPEQVGD